MNTETIWKEITIAALLGTQRKPYQPSSVGGKLGGLLTNAASVEPAVAQLAPLNHERRLLCDAAITVLHRKAGRLPAKGNPVFPGACPPEIWPRCSQQAGNYLAQILTGSSSLLVEWIDLACQHQQRAREEHLPLLLEQQKLIQPLRQKLMPVLGERGRWLAAQNPDWHAFAAFSDERIWSEGQRRERLAFFGDLRAREPNRARELLAATWKEETPSERVSFLSQMAEGLCMGDEPFLEAVLEDRRKDVRQAAADLLARLPESRLVGRMVSRARQLLKWKNGLLRSTLEVSVPEDCDAAMQRDGIDPRLPAGENLGEKAWWLAQILSFVPPRTWTAAWNRKPQQILEMARKHEWEEALLEGWKEAAIRAQDGDWLEAMITQDLRRGEGKRVRELMPRLPVPVKERLVLAALQENPTLSYESNASIYLSICRHVWSAELTQAVIQVICWTLQKGEMHPWRWEILLRDIPPYFHPDLIDPAVERIAQALDRKFTGDPSVQSLLSALAFRARMRRAFLAEQANPITKEPR